MLRLVVISKKPDAEDTTVYQVFEDNKELAVYECTEGVLDAATVEEIRVANYAKA